jgi:hypothetical protein
VARSPATGLPGPAANFVSSFGQCEQQWTLFDHFLLT